MPLLFPKVHVPGSVPVPEAVCIDGTSALSSKHSIAHTLLLGLRPSSLNCVLDSPPINFLPKSAPKLIDEGSRVKFLTDLVVLRLT